MGVGMGIGIVIGFLISLIAAAIVYDIYYRQRRHRLSNFWMPGQEIEIKWGFTSRALNTQRAIAAERDRIDRRRIVVWMRRAIISFGDTQRPVWAAQ